MSVVFVVSKHEFNAGNMKIITSNGTNACYKYNTKGEGSNALLKYISLLVA